MASSKSDENESPLKNLIASAPITRLSSAFEWASKLKPVEQGSDGNRTARDTSTYALVLDTAKLMSSVVGNGVLSNWIAHSANPGILKTLTALTPKRDAGWGWSKPVVYVREKSLLERFLTAKFTIIRYLILLKVQLHKALLVSTVPAAIKVKLTAVNFILKLLASKDVRKTWWYIRYLLNALVQGHLSLLRGIIGVLEVKYPALKGYGVPDSSSGYPWDAWKVKNNPAVKYGTPEVSYGTPEIKYGVPETQYGTPEVSYGQKDKPAVYVADTSYGIPPTPKPSYGLIDYVQVSTPEVSYGAQAEAQKPYTLSNPLYAFPTFKDAVVQSVSTGDYSAPGPNYPTLPPVHIPDGLQGVSTGDGVVVSGDFLRNLIASQSKVVPKFTVAESHAKATRSNEVKKEKKPGFSSQLLLSGFSRT